MKKTFFILLVLVNMFAQAAVPPNVMDRNVPHPAGSRWVSNNGKYELVMQPDGYLVENKITAYGKLKIWQFPNDGKGIPGSFVFYATVFEHAGEPFYFYVGLSFGVNNMLIESWDDDAWYGLRAGFLVMEDSGNMHITTGNNLQDIIWNSNTSDYKIQPLNHFLKGKNVVFPYAITEEFDAAYFTIGKISLQDNCKLKQDKARLSFLSSSMLEMLPGFETDVSKNGSFEAKSLVPKSTPTPKSKIIYMPYVRNPIVAAKTKKTEKTSQLDNTYAGSKFALFPNPTQGTTNIMLDNDETIKSILLFDVTGKQVAQYNNTLIFNMDSFSDGMYLCKIETDKYLYTIKVIKQQ